MSRKSQIKDFAVILITMLSSAALYYNLSRFVVRTAGDDLAFVEAAERLSLPQYVSDIFMRFSGRISAKTMEYLSGISPVAFWHILETLCLVACGWVLFLFFRLFSEKKELNIPVLIACMLVPMLPHPMTFNESFLWIAGTTNYSLIIIPGLYSAYLICRHIKTGILPFWQKLAAAVLMVWSCCGSEQAAAVIMVLLFFFNLRSIITKHVDRFTLSAFLISAVCFIICHVIAPGTRGRFTYELSQTPDFYTIPVLRHANYALRWYMNASINRMGFLISFTLILEAGLILIKKDKTRPLTALAVSCLVFSVIHLLSNFLPQLTDFMIGWGRGDFTAVSYMLLFIWGFGLLLMLSSALFSSKKYGNALFLIVLAALTSLLVITLSPSMYPSGYRTGHVSAMLLSVLLAVLTAELVNRTKKKAVISVLLMSAVLVAFIWHYNQLYRLVSNGFEAFYSGFIF